MNTGGDITVQLRLESKRAVADAKKAAVDVKREFDNAGSNIPKSPMAKGTKVTDWVAQQNANKAAGGKFNPATMGFDPPAAGGAGAAAGEGGGAAGAGGFARLGAAGPVGLAILAAAAAVVVLAKAAKMLTDVMRKASDEASRLYAKALQNGAGLGYTTAADAFSNALGVSEADVFRYGAAIKYLNERMGDSIRIMAKTTPNLTSVNWEFQALWYRVKAVTAVFANELAGTFRIALNAINEVAKALTPFVKVLGSIVNLMIRHSVLFSIARMIGKDGGSAGAPTSSYNRLASSAWERMGFVVGQGGANYAAQTASNTKRMAALMEKLVSKFSTQDNGGRTFAQPNGA